MGESRAMLNNSTRISMQCPIPWVGGDLYAVVYYSLTMEHLSGYERLYSGISGCVNSSLIIVHPHIGEPYMRTG